MYSVRNIICLLLGICLITFQLQSTFAAALLFSDDSYRPDDKIILKNVWEETNPLKKIKYTMLAYARPTVDIMKVTARTVPSFYELENFDATEYYMRLPTTNQRKKKLIDVVYMLWDQIRSDLVSRKSTLSYTQRVFYFKILNMFSKKISNINDLSELQDKVNNEIKNFKEKDVVIPEWNKFETVANLKNIINDEDKCMEIFLNIKSTGMHGITSTNIDFRMPESCVKELEKCNENEFKKKFTYAPHQMLLYVGYVINVKENGTFQRISLSDIHVHSDINSLGCIKAGLLLYYEALNEKFWKTIKPEDDAYEIISESINYGIKPISQENYSEAYKLLNSFVEPLVLTDLSVKGMVALYENILHETDTKMRLLKHYLPELRKKKSRVMFYKLLHWLKSSILKGKKPFLDFSQRTSESDKPCPPNPNKSNVLFSDKFQEVVNYIEKIQAREAKEIGQIEERNIDHVSNFDTLMKELNHFDRDDLDADTSNTIINPSKDDQKRGDFSNSHNTSPEATQIDHSSSKDSAVTGISSENVVHEDNDGTTVNSSSSSESSHPTRIHSSGGNQG